MPNRWKAHSFNGVSYDQYQPNHSFVPAPSFVNAAQRPSEPSRPYNQPRLARASSLSFQTHEKFLNIKVTMDFQGDIDSMTGNWTPEEMKCSRRLVYITAIQQYNHLTLLFKPVAQKDYIPGSSVISCIYWEKTGRYYITSVDLISLLEHLVQSRFPVEEKNRIRRNLQSIKPLTISKTNEECQDFFDLIMNFNNPKPRHIEKGVKVIYWDHLTEALAKVLSKYTVDPSALDLTPASANYTTASSSTQFYSNSSQNFSSSLPIDDDYYPLNRIKPEPTTPQNFVQPDLNQQPFHIDTHTVQGNSTDSNSNQVTYTSMPMSNNENFPIEQSNHYQPYGGMLPSGAPIYQQHFPIQQTTSQIFYQDGYNTQNESMHYDQFGNPIYRFTQ